MSQEFEVVIGIEVHAQLKTKTKLFCGSSTRFGATPNTQISPVNLGLPGALPVLNKEAVRMAIMAGLALNCTINHKSVFSRKNYFYPDLPKGYQISQFDLPICEHGHLDIDLGSEEGSTKRIGITRIHMEEDAGKLVHQGADAIAGSTHSLVDLNRAGTPLIEIVSEPDIRSEKEARAYMEKLKIIVQHLGICDGNLDEGSMRADANISIRPVGQKEFGTRTEVKNLNSFRSLERAILVEVARQKKIVLSGGEVVQETRNYDDATQTTTPLRSKEDAHDYRYFPEPDLPPLIVSDEEISKIEDELPELPEVKLSRYRSDYGLSDFDCKVLIGDVAMDHYFNATVNQFTGLSPKEICKWLVGDLSALMNDEQVSIDTIKVTPDKLGDLLQLLAAGKISGKMAKEILSNCFKTGKMPSDIVKESGVEQISDTGALETMIEQVMSDNPDVVEKIKNGKTSAMGFLMGQIMKASRGQAKPDLVKDLLAKKLG